MANPPPGMTRDDFIHAVDYAIRERKTAKISGNIDNCVELTEAQQIRIRDAITGIIEAAGWSPYHKVAHKIHLDAPMTSPVPWRFYMLDKAACCGVLDAIRSQAENNSDPKWERAMMKRIPRLLAGTDVLIQVTWLPEPSHSDIETVGFSHRNIEHVAAASAAIQNLMLAAEARGMHTYWSSGGILRESLLFDMMEIPQTEKLLGAMFLAFEDEVISEPDKGAHRGKQGDDWYTWVTLKTQEDLS